MLESMTVNDHPSRWPPHINLLYPFVGDKKGDLKEAAHLVSEELSKIRPFEVSLNLTLHLQRVLPLLKS